MKTTTTKPEVRTIAAGEFKAKCLQLMDEVQAGKLTLIVTKRGKAVMQASAPPLPKAPKPKSFIGASKGSMTIHGDIVSALPNEWASAEED